MIRPTLDQLCNYAAKVIRRDLETGRVYDIVSDGLIDRESISAERLRTICEFGLKVASGNASPNFVRYVQEARTGEKISSEG